MDGFVIKNPGVAWQVISPQEARSVILYRRAVLRVFWATGA